MTVLSAGQAAGIRLLGRRPASLFSDSDVFGLELGELATEAVADIADFYDWQKLKVLQNHEGDGSTIAFNLPIDFGRMLKDGEVHSLTWRDKPFRKARDENDWIRLQQVAPSGTPGVWIILGGQMQIFPPMPVGETAQYYYISNNLVAESVDVPTATSFGTLVDHAGNVLIDGNANTFLGFETFLNKSAFTEDDDVFVLSERLLTLSLIWRWRAQKRMEYSEDLTNYETALATATANDKGARILVTGTRRGSASRAMPGADGVYRGRINA